MEENLPIFQAEDGQWWFWGLDGRIGPYREHEMAVEKYWTYRAYVIEAPECHHP